MAPVGPWWALVIFSRDQGASLWGPDALGRGRSMNLARPGLFRYWVTDITDGIHLHSTTAVSLIHRPTSCAPTLRGQLLVGAAADHAWRAQPLGGGSELVSLVGMPIVHSSWMPSSMVVQGRRSHPWLRHVVRTPSTGARPSAASEQYLPTSPSGSFSRSWNWPSFVSQSRIPAP